ncbi:N-acetylmuramoyl-L-alanine amidase [Salmonirosea aquatica]|uniref:N-acetylmuramoyl-L-alanine amidase n=1 Tax=Salmonirosea aquatica TaxID=2654236 RepID=A0A7C9BGQ9_9BACT|nr:N-acetylmuramoyl-L-alanine amidase [Cytophagaceae bacterium SJW1-29]
MPGFDEAIEAVILRNAIATRLIERGVNVYVDQNDTTNAETWSKIKEIAHFEDVLLDLHFNAASPQATGTEVFYKTSRFLQPQPTAAKLSASVADALRIKDRGAKNESQSQHNRLGVLHLNPERSFLLETCFITNPGDVREYRYYFPM